MLLSTIISLLAASCSCLALPASSSAAASGKFSVLTYNVAGLPAIINGNGSGNKTANTLDIGSRFAAGGWDVIHVQEDFNYHKYLYQTDNHPYRTPTSGGVPFGSGLNTLSKFPYKNLDRITW